MRTIGIIGAMEEEISFLREKMDIVTTKSVVGLTYYVGRYEGNNVVLVKSGIGKVNAAVCTQAMIDHFGVDYIINTGVAGGLSPELHVGDILISVDAVQHDMDTSAFGDPIGVIPRMAESYFKPMKPLWNWHRKRQKHAVWTAVSSPDVWQAATSSSLPRKPKIKSAKPSKGTVRKWKGLPLPMPAG